ncbi:MAG TPA: AMP-binding protein [Salinivirgaceae bacterium]|nr:AMP-binding protein [Salinivirgaceae bacterium]
MINIRNLATPAVITKEKTYSYSDLLSMIDQFSKFFENKNCEHVAIYSENRIEWIAAFYAAWKNDVIVITIDYMSSNDDLSYILNDSQPQILFASDQLQSNVTEAFKSIDYLPETIYFGTITLDTTNGSAAWEYPSDITKTAVIIYTSGTVGNPKGVMLSYENLITNILAVSEDVKIYTKDRQVLMLLPLHHIFPLAGTLLAPLYVGSTIVMSPSMQSSDLLETLKNNRVAIILGVPRLYEIIYSGVKAKIDAKPIGRLFYNIVKLSRSKRLAKIIFKKVHQSLGGEVDFLVSGGAALPKHVGAFFQTLGFDVLEGYGMTEAAPMITFTRPGKVLIGSPGNSLSAVEIKICDGEITVRGSNIMKGYYNRPNETAEVLKDGWLYTGDLGYFDKKGYLFITGRKKDIIVLSNGKNINPVELEQKFEAKYQEVDEAGVFFHRGTLYIAVKANNSFLAEQGVTDIENHFKSKVLPDFNSGLTSYSKIMKFVLFDCELPRTRLGKIQRYKLADYIANPQTEEDNSDYVPSEDFIAVKKFLETQVDVNVKPSHHIEFDLALDSLGKLSLIDFIQRSFGINLDEKRLINFPSLKDLSEYIKEKRQWFRQETVNWAEALKEKIDVKLPKSWPTHNLIKTTAKYFFKLYFRFKGEGCENIPEGPCIIAPNHQSFFDGLFVASFLKRKVIKQTYFYAKKKHVNNAILRFMASINNVIVMDLDKNLIESIQKMAAALKAGKKVIIFPEGTRTKDGKVGEFKKTFAILSTILNVPVVPVSIVGADKALPIGSKLPRFWAKVTVKFLPVQYPEGQTVESLSRNVRNTIERSILHAS